MEMSLFKKDGVTWTRFKVAVKEKKLWFMYLITKIGIDVSKPSKTSSRFVYFEKEGDLINRR